MPSRRGITIYDIAKEAGVSPSTVSRVLTHSPGVRPEKRALVQALVDKHHFIPNVMAKNLSETTRRMIGMVCADVRNPYYAGLFVECERAAYDRGYVLILHNTFAQDDLEILSLEKMYEQRVDAIIVSGGVIDRIEPPQPYLKTLARVAAAMPVVIAGLADNPQCYQVAIDHAEGMRLAVTHLTSLGHTRIAYLTCAPGIYLSRDKLDAFFEAMHAAGLAVRREYIVEGRDFNERTGYSSMNRLLNLQERPTAVIAINDLTAAGALQAIVHSGYRVPDDFSLLSFDNSFIAGLMTPSITGLDYRYDAYGRMLIDTALGAIKEKKPQGVTRVQPTLVIKDSCRKV